ncbi:MAG: prefoldin subunit alpha [Thermoplasmata archaeon]|nr:prefoldin subunit alpha [Thermoplasmata archaeon]
MPVSEEEVRQMLSVLDQYRYQAERLTQQLSLLTNSDQELGAAWDFLKSFEEAEEGAEVKVPIGGGVFVSARVIRPDKVLTAVGNDVSIEIPPADAAQEIGKRRDQVREMMQQVKGSIEQTEASAVALQQQAEAAFQELQASKE